MSKKDTALLLLLMVIIEHQEEQYAYLSEKNIELQEKAITISNRFNCLLMDMYNLIANTNAMPRR